MADFLFIVCLFGSFFGFLYPLVVSVALLIGTLCNRAFRPRPAHWLSLLAPALTYYVLEYLVAKRQDWNIVTAIVPLSGFGVLVVAVACALSKPRALSIGAAVGVLVAIALWWWIPLSTWNRMM